MRADRTDWQGYDIIGDIHGCCDALIKLLEKLGYRHQAGRYCHPHRQAIFVGDLVDRGPQIRETLHLVRDMVEQGNAQMVLGNHELNAICFHTPANPDSGQTWLRERTERHTRQIEQTLWQFRHHEGELEEFIAWLLTLPLYLEFDHFRVVHACWDQRLVDEFRENYDSHIISEQLLQRTTDYQSLEYRLVNRLTRGTDMLLPDNEVIVGSDGYRRRFFRTKFWLQEPKTYGDILFQPDALPPHIHQRELDEEARRQLLNYGETELPLFVGHYWRYGEPSLVQPNIACLDYSAVNGGRLVAYRLDGPGVLDETNFVWVDADLDAVIQESR